MNWKEFFKPTLLKVIFTIIFFIILIPLIYVYYDGFTNPYVSRQCITQSPKCDKFCNEGIEGEVQDKTGTPLKTSIICCCALWNKGMHEVILEVYRISFARYQFHYYQYIILLVVSYILSTVLIYIYKKFKKQNA